MFGFSLPKIALLLIIIFVIWQIFRIIEKNKNSKVSSSSSEKDKDEFYEQLIECSNCGNFYSNVKSNTCPMCGAKN